MNFQFLTTIASFKPSNLHITIFSFRLAVTLILVSNVFITHEWEARINNIDIRKTVQSLPFVDSDSALEYNNF